MTVSFDYKIFFEYLGTKLYYLHYRITRSSIKMIRQFKAIKCCHFMCTKAIIIIFMHHDLAGFSKWKG